MRFGILRLVSFNLQKESISDQLSQSVGLVLLRLAYRETHESARLHRLPLLGADRSVHG